MHLLSEGGPIFMFPILFLLIAVIIIVVMGLMKPEKRKKLRELAASLGLFALVWGVIGQILGLINAFDAIEFAGNVSTNILAGGLKLTFLASLFGAFTFFISRIGTTILKWKE